MEFYAPLNCRYFVHFVGDYFWVKNITPYEINSLLTLFLQSNSLENPKFPRNYIYKTTMQMNRLMLLDLTN